MIRRIFGKIDKQRGGEKGRKERKEKEGKRKTKTK